MRVDTLRPYFLLTILFAALALVFFIFKPFLAPLALAAVFAVILRPVYNRLLPYVAGRDALAALGTLVFVLLCILVPLGVVATQIVLEAQGLYASLAGGDNFALMTGLVERVASLASQVVPGVSLNAANLMAELNTYAGQGLQFLISHLGGLLSSATVLLLNLFIFFISLYFLLKDGPALKRKVIELSPLYDTDDELIFNRLGLAINSVVKGSLLIALIQGALATAGYIFFGVPNAVLWGTTTAIAALIPGVGTALVLGPVVLYLFVAGSLLQAVGLLVWGALAVGLIDNMLGPKLIGRAAQLHPLLILLSVLGGLAFFGPAGLFLGPLSISLFLAILSIHAHTLVRH